MSPSAQGTRPGQWSFKSGPPAAQGNGNGAITRRLAFAGACLTSALLLLPGSAAAPAMASTSVPVTINSTVIVGPFTGTWSASGGISDSGTLVEPTVNFVGNGELHIVRDVTGSRGTFTLRLDSKVVAVEPDGSDVFSGHWVVIAGTGAYADLHGQGMRNAVVTNGVVTETLTGSVHHD